MPFDATGRFIPDSTQVSSNQSVQPTASFRPPQLSVQNALVQAQPMQQQTFAQSIANRQLQQPAIMRAGIQNYMPLAGQPQPPAQAAQPQQAPQPVPQQAPPAYAPSAYGQPPMSWGGPMYGYAQGMAPPQQGPSIEQSVNTGSPQSVQNFLSALRQVGAGGNNTFMNGAGQQGAGPQGGFQGFGVNGYQGPMYGGIGQQPAVYAGAAGGQQLGWQGNMANAYGNYNVGNYAQQGGYGQAPAPYFSGGGVQAGGTGGVQGQPQWQTPLPWGNPLNNPGGTPGSGWGSASDELNASGPFQGSQGAFYSNQGVTAGGQGPNQDQIGPNPNVVSDIQAKTNIQSADKDLEEFLNALGVYKYEYKNKKYGEGERISPMAQEIEKTQLGKVAISTNPEGYKQVDYGKLAGTQLAALALLNHKYNQLEAKLKTAITTKLSKRGK